ncbi:MAG: hypothetical protein ACYSR5_12655 [Planctomycetota bacterium]|jgi:hypothetical protein
MAFWIGILVGAAFARFAISKGFYETWAIFFNILIAVYLAVYLRPLIVDIAALGDMPYSNALTMTGTAVGLFLVLHGVTYTFVTGQMTVAFPKVFDVVGSALLGFLGGLLIWSFLTLLVCITPLSQSGFGKSIGFDSAAFERGDVSYISWWCNLVNRVVSSEADRVTGELTISELVASVKKPARVERAEQPEPDESAEPTKPSEAETTTRRREQLGPPPEIPPEEF